MREDREFERTLEYLAKGILLGGALGAIAGWFVVDLTRGIFLGGLCGCIASLTMKGIRDKRGKRK